MLDLEQWKVYIESLDYRPLFVTVSGAHLYGFPSPDSDVDLRGCHQLPLRDVVGLKLPNETVERTDENAGVEVDLVSHEVGKYLRLLVRNNGYVLEQIFSPLVVTGHEFLDRLRPIAARCVTRHHYHHYRGFYATQRKLLDKQEAKTAKAVLYAYRVLSSGIHLLRTGCVEANLNRLNEHFGLTFLDELIAMKTAEKAAPGQLDWPFHEAQLGQLEAALEQAFDESPLPEDRDWQAVNEFLVNLRLAGGDNTTD
jgi:uncharacterized protein